MHRKIFAMSLDSRPKFINLAHHHSEHAKYWSEPQASVNRDFTRVVFNSDWADNVAPTDPLDIDTYMVSLGW